MSQVVGLVHNHPWLIYGATSELALLNRYPSGGVLPGGDWAAATYMVSKGAGGAGGADFAMYVIDTKGNLREFHYSDHEVYEALLKSLNVRQDFLHCPTKWRTMAAHAVEASPVNLGSGFCCNGLCRAEGAYTDARWRRIFRR